METLWDPDDPLTIALVQLYSMDTFIQHEINNSSRNEDLMMVDSLGPYAAVLNQIVLGRESQNTSFLMDSSSFISPSNSITVWRATLLTEEQIENYYASVHQRKKVQLKGFVSCSLNRDFALNWILSNDELPNGKMLVLFEIQVAGSKNHFFMNSPQYSMYSMEEEVLLGDGLRCKVIDIKKIKENLGDFPVDDDCNGLSDQVVDSNTIPDVISSPLIGSVSSIK